MSSSPRSFTELSGDPSWYASLVAEATSPYRSRTEMTLAACRARIARLHYIRHERMTSNSEPSIRQIIADVKKQFYAAISAQKPDLPTTSVKVLAELKRIRKENRAYRGLADAVQKAEGTGIRRIGPTVYRHGSRVYDVGAYGGDPSRMEALLRPETQCHVPQRRVAPTADHNRVVNLRPWAAAESRHRRKPGSSRRPPLSTKSLQILEDLSQVREDNRSQGIKKRRLSPMPVPPSVIKKARLSQCFKAPERRVHTVAHLEESTTPSSEGKGRTDSDSDLDINVNSSVPPTTGRCRSILGKRKQRLEVSCIKKRESEDGVEKKPSHITCQRRNVITSSSITNEGFGFTLVSAVSRTRPTAAISFVDDAIDSGIRRKRQCGTQREESLSQPAPHPVRLPNASEKTAIVLEIKGVGRGLSQEDRVALKSRTLSALEQTNYNVADNPQRGSRCDKKQSPPDASIVSIERASLNVAMPSRGMKGETILPLLNTYASRSEILLARPVSDSEPPANPQRDPENAKDPKHEGHCGSNNQGLPAASPVSVQRASLKEDTMSQVNVFHPRSGKKPKDSFWAGVNKFLNG